MATQYQEWAKRNWPTPAANDPDRFVEFSQADLDAYAEKAFVAGSRGVVSDKNWWQQRYFKESATCDRLRVELNAEVRNLVIYRGLAVLGWAGAVLSLIGV